MSQQKIVVLATGGTIAGRASQPGDNIGYTAAQVGIQELVGGIPALGALADAGELLLEQVAQVDSKDMSFAVWTDLALRVSHYLGRPDVQGIVITHGTDTLEETAYFLQLLLAPAKPVVLTCAMRPATALVPDGPQNLLDAVAVASHADAAGVVAVCAGEIHGAQDVQKIHPYRCDAFSSGDAGVLGFVEEGGLRLLRNWPGNPRRDPFAKNLDAESLGGRSWPRVEIVMNYAGADGACVRALVAAGVQGLVVACTGNGTRHNDLESALVAAQAGGVRVLSASRCVFGRVLPRKDDMLKDSEGLSPVKARIALMLELMAGAG